ncbi:MAG: hypothetical protein P1V97_07415 [Planctomycetota bacterium]|nr:hypothetical protein [Planctomycetota bacterium]
MNDLFVNSDLRGVAQMTGKRRVDIEGYSTDEILNMEASELEAFVFVGESLIIKSGTAEILGEFRKTETILTVELAHIDGGGEGILPTLSLLVQRYAKNHGFASVEWVVHAINCANPNPKLKRVLEKRGFVIKEVGGIGNAYYKRIEF